MGRWAIHNPATFSGRKQAFEYVNDEGYTNYVKTCCGQAAVCTAGAILTLKHQDWTDTKMKNMLQVDRYRPDNAGGHLGTSKGRVLYMIKDFLGMTYEMVYGWENIRARLTKKDPVIIMADVAAAGWTNCKFGIGLHWSVVYGFTPWNYMLSNWVQPGKSGDIESWDGSNLIDRGPLENATKTWICKALGMADQGIVVKFK